MRGTTWGNVRRIGVLTSDFALYHDLVKALRERGLAFSSLAFGETPDPSVGVLLTSWRDSVGERLPEDPPLVVVPLGPNGHEDVEAAIAQALRVLEGVRGYAEVVVGIDPGLRPGVAVLADGRLLHTTQVFRVRDTAALARSLLDQYPHDRAAVRIGHGAPRERDKILEGLWALREEGVRIEVVDETGTTPPTGAVKWPPDVAAAIDIARTPGRTPSNAPRLRASAGQVREVQRMSRIESGGRVTITRERAARVARGEITMIEAVEEETRALRLRKRNRPSSRRASKG